MELQELANFDWPFSITRQPYDGMSSSLNIFNPMRTTTTILIVALVSLESMVVRIAEDRISAIKSVKISAGSWHRLPLKIRQGQWVKRRLQ